MSQQQAHGLVTPKAAARMLNIDPYSVRRAIKAKRLYAVKRGARWYIPLSDVRRYKKPK